jgi:hypothetical protein
MDLNVVKLISTRELRGIECPGYVFAVKRSCILSCPLPAFRVFSQLHLFARSCELHSVRPTCCFLERAQKVFRSCWRPLGSFFKPSTKRFDPRNITLEIQFFQASGSNFLPRLTLSSSEELLHGWPSPRGSEEPRDELSQRLGPRRISHAETGVQISAPWRSELSRSFCSGPEGLKRKALVAQTSRGLSLITQRTPRSENHDERHAITSRPQGTRDSRPRIPETPKGFVTVWSKALRPRGPFIVERLRCAPRGMNDVCALRSGPGKLLIA